MLTQQQFDRTRRLALSLAGIELVERHRELLHHRCRRFGIVDSAGLDTLLGAAEAGDREAAGRLTCLLTTKFTGFFRHPQHFDLAAAHVLSAAKQRGQARLWSAAAATGEEPYSMAMALIEFFGRDDPPVSILATDISVDALAVAQLGAYSDSALRAVEPARRERFFVRDDAARSSRVIAAARGLVVFRVLNLADAEWSVAGVFDVIFCRNVLMYLEAGLRRVVVERMASMLAPDGLLMLDPVEDIGAAAHLFAPRAGGVFALRRASRAEAAPKPGERIGEPMRPES